MENMNVTALPGRKTLNTSAMVKIAMLSAVSIVLMMFEFSLPVFPFFLKLDISDLPALIGAVSMGPVAGILIELIKNILHLFKTSTAGVGEIANFLTGIALVVPMGMIYKKKKTIFGYVLGALSGTACMVVVACVFNYYVLIPAFALAFGMNVQDFADIANKITPVVVDFKTLILFSIGPFNALKAVVVSIIGYIVCNLLKKVL